MISKTILEHKYLIEKKSLRMIAQELNCSKKKVSYWMNYHSIPKRSLKEARNNRSSRGREFRDIVNINNLIEYYNDGHSIKQCANFFNIGYTAVQDRLSTYGASRKSWEHRIGTNHSDSTKKKMSKTATAQISEGARSSHCQGKSYYCMSPKQGRIKVRSSWERDYADYLYSSNINFLYEYKVFELSNGKSYVPDFYLPDTDEYIEIKGYLSEDQESKYELFKKEFPNVKWKMLRKEDLVNILRDKKKVIVLTGTQASGKSWVGNQLTDKYYVIDKDKDSSYLNTMRSYSGNKSILLQLPFKVSTFVNKHSHEFDIVVISITGDFIKVKQNLINRGGKVTKTTYTRWKRILSITKKYCDHTGDSDQVLSLLKHTDV